MAENTSSEEKSLYALKRIRGLALIWAGLVLFILLLQAYFYNGLYARVAEWQFSKFGTLFPFSGLLLTVLILSLPLILLYAIRKRRHRRLYGKPTSTARLQNVQKKYGFLKVLTIGVIMSTLFVSISSLIVADHSDREAQIVTAVNLITHDGPITAEANVLYNRLASYSQKTLLTRNDVLLAPLILSDTDTTLRHFIVVDDKSIAGPAQRKTLSGYARKTKLPGGFRVLYKNSGYTVAKDTYVIHKSVMSARKRRFGLAETLARLSFWLCLALLFTFAYMRHLRREDQESVNPNI